MPRLEAIIGQRQMQPHYQYRQPQAGFPWLPILLVVGGVVLLGIIALGLFVWYVAQEPEGVQVDIFVSDQIYAGEPFELVVAVTNTSGETKRVDAIDFENNLLQHVEVVRSNPAWKRIESVPFVGKSYVFRKSISPGDTVRFSFTMRTEKLGWHFSTVAVYFGIGLQGIMNEIQFVVDSPK